MLGFRNGSHCMTPQRVKWNICKFIVDLGINLHFQITPWIQITENISNLHFAIYRFCFVPKLMKLQWIRSFSISINLSLKGSPRLSIQLTARSQNSQIRMTHWSKILSKNDVTRICFTQQAKNQVGLIFLTLPATLLAGQLFKKR